MRRELWFGFIVMALVLLSVALLMPWNNLQDGHIGLLMLGLIVTAIMLGFPTAFTLMGMGMIFCFIAYYRVDPNTASRLTLELMVQRAYSVVTNDVLVAIPLFVFMGYLVERTSLISKLFQSLHLAMFRIPGSLAVATLFTCAIFATATGIVGAVITLMGLLAMPTMLKAGYNVKVVAGAITAGGCLGILLPPSVLLIIYSATAGVSVVKLYAGAVFPGLMLAFLYVGYVIILAIFKPKLMPPLPESERHIPLSPLATQLSGGDGQQLVFPNLLQRLRQASSSRSSGRKSALAINVATLALPAVMLVTTFALATWSHTQTHSMETLVAAVDVADNSAGGMFGMAPPSFDSEDSTSDAVAANSGLSHWLWWFTAIVAAACVWFYRRLSFNRLEIFKMLLASFFPLTILMATVLGSIAFGIATPTEAAAVGAFGGAVLAFAYRKLSFSVVKESVYLTSKTTAMVCWLFVGSAIFSAAFALLGGQDIIEQWVLSLGLTKIQFMLLAQLIIFLLGWPLEWTEIIVIFMPIFIPLLPHFDVDPLFFGLLVALNLQTAYLSPPVAMSAFYLKGVAPKEVTLNQIFAGMLPFMGIQIVALFILYLFPQIGLWLPKVLYQ